MASLLWLCCTCSTLVHGAAILRYTWCTVVVCVVHGWLQSEANASKLEALRSRTWGLMLLDETHQLVAKTYKQVLEFAPAHCHLGLTATVCACL